MDVHPGRLRRQPWIMTGLEACLERRCVQCSRTCTFYKRWVHYSTMALAIRNVPGVTLGAIDIATPSIDIATPAIDYSYYGPLFRLDRRRLWIARCKSTCRRDSDGPLMQRSFHTNTTPATIPWTTSMDGLPTHAALNPGESLLPLVGQTPLTLNLVYKI